MRRFVWCGAALAAITPIAFSLPTVPASASPSADSAHHGRPKADEYTARQILVGLDLSHTFTPAGMSSSSSEPLADPDDITLLGNHIFVGFQNGVGPQGQPGADGNQDSTVVEMTRTGTPVSQWDVQGKTDGVTADPIADDVIATVNEDANSSLYTINPDAPKGAQVTHYIYDEPLPHNGGTDAISIYRGQILISASAPGTTGLPAPQPAYPAVYSVQLNPATEVATVAAVFFDESSARIANVNSPSFGQSVTLGLTDPDSNEVVPRGARFGGDFMLTSQGDQQQIYLRPTRWSAGSPALEVLNLSQSVDDTAWPTSSRGTLYSTDSTNDAVDAITGPFRTNQPLAVATPCGANSAPATCPAPPAFPANFLASLNPWTGAVSALAVQGATYTPQGGLLFVPGPSKHR
jgi:hypothetical protein